METAHFAPTFQTSKWRSALPDKVSCQSNERHRSFRSSILVGIEGPLIPPCVGHHRSRLELLTTNSDVVQNINTDQHTLAARTCLRANGHACSQSRRLLCGSPHRQSNRSHRLGSCRSTHCHLRRSSYVLPLGYRSSSFSVSPHQPAQHSHNLTIPSESRIHPSHRLTLRQPQ